MERSVSALLVVCAAAVMVLATGAAAVGSEAAKEVPIHMTTGQPTALQHADAEAEGEHVRFAEADAEAESEGESDAESEADAEAEAEDEAEAEAEADAEDAAEGESIYDEVVDHPVPHVPHTPHVPNAKYDEFISHAALPPLKTPWKAPGKWKTNFARDDKALSAAEDAELERVDTVMSESTNTMTQSARCLMFCANTNGLCTSRNPGGCACAAGCMCNRGEAEATCAEHCHPDNQMSFVYGYADANHFSPHMWGKSIGDVMSDYKQVRTCLAGCAKRGQCKPRFCPRHPSGGYKCSACKRQSHLSKVNRIHHNKESGAKGYGTKRRRSHRRGRRSHRHRHGHHIHRIVKVEHGHDHVDEYGHIIRHHHSHTQLHHIHPAAYPAYAAFYPAMVESDAAASASAESDAETEAETGAQVDAQAEAEAEADIAAEHELEAEAEAVSEVAAEAEADAEADSEASIEAEAAAEAEQGFIRVTHTPLTTTVASDGSNIPRWAPRVVRRAVKTPVGGADMADNGIVSSITKQDPNAFEIDCNFYDCTGLQSEPHVAAGSLNPVVPWRYPGETRTVSFTTVPDMLEPHAEAKMVVVA